VGDIDDFERSTRRGRQVRMLVMALVISSPFLWLGWRCHQERAKRDAWQEEARQRDMLSAAEKAELDKLLPELHRTIQAASKAFAEDVTPAKLGAIVPGDAPCPYSTRSSADDLDAKLGTHYAMLEASSQKYYKPGEQPVAENLKTAAGSLADLETRIKQRDDAEPTKYDLETVRRLAGDVKQVMFVVGERNEPVVMADAYIPGRVRGTAFLYAIAERKVVCAVDIDVQNAPEVKFEYRTSRYDTTGLSSKYAAATAELLRDLATKTNRAISTGMRAVR
jgi:hypothetical protein